MAHLIHDASQVGQDWTWMSAASPYSPEASPGRLTMSLRMAEESRADLPAFRSRIAGIVEGMVYVMPGFVAVEHGNDAARVVAEYGIHVETGPGTP